MDVKLTKNAITIDNADITIGASNFQEITLMLQCYPGWIRNQYNIGIGIDSYINAKNLSLVKPLLFTQCSKTRNIINDLIVSGENITIVAPKV